MGRVISWKIDDYKYGYIKSPNGKSHIHERITEENNPGLITSMANTVKSWDLNTYTENFNEMNREILTTFGVSIPGEAIDYFDEESGDKNYIVLTGKDGSSSCNGEISDEDIEKITKVLDAKISSTISDIQSLEVSIKSWVSDKVNSSISSANVMSQSVINSVNEMVQEMSDKLDNAESAIQTAASLFDMNNSGVNKENLELAINYSNSAMSWAIATDLKNKHTDSDIKNINNAISLLNEKQNSVLNTVSKINSTVSTNISRMSERITRLEDDVVNIKESNPYLYSTESTANNDVRLESSGVVKKIQANAQSNIITNITENDDGTYTSNIKIGNESYDVNIIGYGGKIDDDNTKEGLSLASNGFKYVNNGSLFSVTNGRIMLSNQDGSASIEINSDGVYINGKKQE